MFLHPWSVNLKHNISHTEHWPSWCSFGHGPLARYRQLWVAHAPGMPGMPSLSTTSKETTSYWTRHASRHVRHARAVMHVRIDNPRCRGKRSRHSRRMRNPCFYVSGKRPITRPSKRTGISCLYHILLWCIYVWIYIYIHIFCYVLSAEDNRVKLDFHPNYNGTTSFTLNGLTCQLRDSQYPHQHYYTYPGLFLKATLEDISNFCRTPDGSEWPWCFTMSPEIRWQACEIDVKLCGGGITSGRPM